MSFDNTRLSLLLSIRHQPRHSTSNSIRQPHWKSSTTTLNNDGFYHKYLSHISWRKIKGIHAVEQRRNDQLQRSWTIKFYTKQCGYICGMHGQDFQTLYLLWLSLTISNHSDFFPGWNGYAWRPCQLDWDLESNRARHCTEQCKYDMGRNVIYWRHSSWNPIHDYWLWRSYWRSLCHSQQYWKRYFSQAL